MSPADDAHPAPFPDSREVALELLRHDLRSRLTTIVGRAQLLTRAIRRSPSLTEEERQRLLDGLAAIESAVWPMVPLIERIGREHLDGREDAE
jgi:hypothetical protein